MLLNLSPGKPVDDEKHVAWPKLTFTGPVPPCWLQSTQYKCMVRTCCLPTSMSGKSITVTSCQFGVICWVQAERQCTDWQRYLLVLPSLCSCPSCLGTYILALEAEQCHSQNFPAIRQLWKGITDFLFCGKTGKFWVAVSRHFVTYSSMEFWLEQVTGLEWPTIVVLEQHVWRSWWSEGVIRMVVFIHSIFKNSSFIFFWVYNYINSPFLPLLPPMYPPFLSFKFMALISLSVT